MTTFNYTQFNLQNPGGDNGLSSYALYFQRMMYKEAIYPTNLKAPIDTWYDKQYYGRVDRLQNTIIPDTTNLKVLTSAGRQNLLALNFVAEAFEDFVEHMRKALVVGALRQGSTANPSILDIKAYQAYSDPTRIYNDFKQQIYNSYFSSLTLSQSEKITDFKTFAESMLQYLRDLSGFIPVTKTNYLLTDVSNSFASGMSIAIDTGPPENDEYKYDNWISDPNFNFYVRAAKKFGFIVNKNIPWILTADLFSNAIMKYIQRYIVNNSLVTKKTFFDDYFDKTYLTDIDDLKQYIVSAYNNYIELRPFGQKTVRIGSCDKFRVETFVRPPLEGDVGLVLTDKMLVDLYLDLRSAEAKNPLQITKKLKNELANIYTLKPNKQISSLQNAAEYINLIYRDYIYDAEYTLLNPTSLIELDNQIRSGNIATVGSIVQQLY